MNIIQNIYRVSAYSNWDFSSFRMIFSDGTWAKVLPDQRKKGLGQRLVTEAGCEMSAGVWKSWMIITFPWKVVLLGLYLV